jgi:Uma2 family endonuclease
LSNLRHKKKTYAETGVREYWIADPIERSIEVHVNKEGDFELAGELKCGKGQRQPAAGKIQSTVYPELSFGCPSVFGLQR